MRTGIVKSFNDERGFGFILPLDDNSGDVFFHIHGLAPGCPIPEIGDRVEYLVGSGRDGRPRAERVRQVGAK